MRTYCWVWNIHLGWTLKRSWEWHPCKAKQPDRKSLSPWSLWGTGSEFWITWTTCFCIFVSATDRWCLLLTAQSNSNWCTMSLLLSFTPFPPSPYFIFHIHLNARISFLKRFAHPLRPRIRTKHSIKHCLAPSGRMNHFALHVFYVALNSEF